MIDPDSENAYQAMVRYLDSGGRLPPAEIRRILKSAGKTAENLVDIVLGSVRDGGPSPGDPCPSCQGGSLVVINSKRRGACQVQYLGCPACGQRPPDGKRCVPAAFIRRRKTNRRN